MGRPATDKRSRLIQAAATQFHRNGLHRTSLAEVARTAGIPPGNTYYYFRSKDELTRAVVDEWAARLVDHFSSFDETDPWESLRAYLAAARERQVGYTAHGCPLAGLSNDLRRQGRHAHVDASRLHSMELEWLAEQFRLGGLPIADAESHARFLLAGIQGAFQLAHATGNQEFIASATAYLNAWLATVSARHCHPA